MKTEQEMNFFLKKKELILEIFKNLAFVYNYDWEKVDYFLTNYDSEYLYFADILINCTGNSYSAIINEVIGFLLLNHTLEYFNLDILINDLESIKNRWISRTYVKDILSRKVA